MTTEELIVRVERLERVIETLQPKKDEWVGATVITKRTGWNNEDLRRARRNGSVKYRIKSEGTKRTYRYLLSSIIQ